MGIYLSTPSTDVALEEGKGSKVKYVVGEMQGWRKTMEDSHIALTDISDSQLKSFLEEHAVKTSTDPAVSLFGVFDGHGGKEVAKFVKLKYPQLVIEQLVANGGDVAAALRESFHKVDELLEDLQYATLLRELRTLPDPCDTMHKSKSTNGANPRPSQMLNTPLEDSDSEEEDDEDEILDVVSSEDKDKKISTQDAVKMIRDMLRRASERPVGETDNTNGEDTPSNTPATDNAAEEAEDETVLELSTDSESAENKSTSGSAEDKVSPPYESAATSQRTRTLPNGLTVTVHAEDEAATSLAVEDTMDVSPHPQSPVPSQLEGEGSEELGAPILPPNPEQLGKKAIGDGNGVVPASRATPEGGVACNLRQHRIMAGCTAVVALHIGNQLYVANAGDSRGVLCRGNGQAYALSYDHKPQQDREMNRIKSAGGFVNNVGRINGNLNLSRSLGDLKYKQLTHLAREDQIITAEPDITVTQLQPDDHFFILACDGVWDCLTNEQACDFVTERLNAGKDAATITNELLHFCLADDTGKSQGIGCDNMTFLLVLFK
eukprot:CAMPEP_0184969744 /NCGR_PEP_ID=MMETSP1098-20130426/2421_1 /TAXON_ID=89044 /ORGANISM="Spumella elongata, Strain CCAP 955/1" /LENGTH=547 /DNA_ID=CAMNT_0027491557 /DNA_START=63 /DNA_END=1706 /DNA_ORIENTATION=-